MISRLLGVWVRPAVLLVLAPSLFSRPVAAQTDTIVTVQVEAPTIPTALLAEIRAAAVQDSLAAADSAAVEENLPASTNQVSEAGRASDTDSLGVAGEDEPAGFDALDSSDKDAASAAMDLLIRARDAGSELPADVIALMIRDALTQPANDTLWSRLEETVVAVYGEEALASVLPEDGLGQDGDAVLFPLITDVGTGSLDAQEAEQGLGTANEGGALGGTTPQNASVMSAVENPEGQTGVDPSPAGDQAEAGSASWSPGDMTREDLVVLWERASGAVAIRVDTSMEQIRALAVSARARLGIDGTSLVWIPWAVVGVLVLGLALQVLMKAARSLLARMGLASSGAYQRAAKMASRLSRKGASSAEVARKTGLPREAIQVLDILKTREKARAKAAVKKPRRAKGAKEVA